MPRALSPIPLTTPITGVSKETLGLITEFFRLRWQELIDAFGSTPLASLLTATGQTASLATTTLLLTPAAGMYRVDYSLIKTVADGVSSSLQVTLTWLSGGLTITHTFAALTTDTIGAEQGQTYPVYADGESAIQIAIAYLSNTPAKMTFAYAASAERLV